MNIVHRTGRVQNNKRGLSLLEVIIALSILAASLGGLVVVYNNHITTTFRNTRVIKAAYLAEEGAEVVRLLRDQGGWTATIVPLTTGASYYTELIMSVWGLTTTLPPPIDGLFTRTIVFDDVYRDVVTQDIVPMGGGSVLDPEARKVTVTVTWSAAAKLQTVRIVTYLTNMFDS